MSTVSADPDDLAEYASGLTTTEGFLRAHGQPLRDALDDFMRRCPDYGFCPTLSARDITDHADRGHMLAEWTGAVGHAIASADEAMPLLTGPLALDTRIVWADDVDMHLYALGAFPLPEEAASWHAGVALGTDVHAALDAGDPDSAEGLLRALGDLEENPIAVAGALAALGDLDAIEERIDDLRPKGPLVKRFLGGAWDATTGTLGTVWDLTGRLAHDPSGFGRSWSGLGSGLWWGVQNPGDFALAVVDWEGLKDDPARWLGGLVPDAIAAVATGGTATAASRGASATRATVRAVRGAENVGDLMDALRRIPDTLVVDVTGRLRTIGGRQVTWSPAGRANASGDIASVSLGAGRGPLSRLADHFAQDPTETFRGSQYVVRRTDEPTVLYRAGSEGSFPLGRFWTTIEPGGPLQAQLDSALVPSWGNRADQVTRIVVPAGETIYEGLAAPQLIFRDADDVVIAGTRGEVFGGGPQVVLPNVPESWISDVHPVGEHPVSLLRRLSRLVRPGRSPDAPEQWLAEMIGRGAVPGVPDSGPPNARAEAMPVHGGIVDGDLLALVLSRCVLITRGGRLGERSILDAQRVTWLGTPPPGLGDGRVAVAEPGGVLLRRPTDPMQRGRTTPQLLDGSGLIGRTIPEAGGGQVVEAVVTPWAWALLLDDGAVVAATNRGEADSITGSGDGTVALACDAPVVVDRAGGRVDLLELRSLPLGEVTA